ncbi:MAG: DUF1311 domain-containing protein [Clostridium sp.]|nr:DUF1311 domain-containing protein [Clostridium sp.]
MKCEKNRTRESERTLKGLLACGFLTGAMVLSACGSAAGTAASSAAAQTPSETVADETVSEAQAGSDAAASPEAGNDEKAENTGLSGASEDASGSSSPDEKKSIDETLAELDFSHDYSGEIKSKVASAATGSASLQEELRKIQKLSEQYDEVFSAAQAQVELNYVAEWSYELWDDELNSLWGRFRESAPKSVVDRVLKEQRNWNAMKKEAVILNIGPAEDGGSMYPMLESGYLKGITENRVYLLAEELAAVRNEKFTMPEKDIYGTYVDNQGTGEIYSSLVLRQGWENDNEALISIHRTGSLCGTFSERGKGTLAFVSDDKKTEGIITIDGWKGASFEVTKAEAGNGFQPGDRFRFEFVL